MDNILQYVKKNFIESSDVEYIIHSGNKENKGYITIIFYSNGHPSILAKVGRESNKIENEYNALKLIQNMNINSKMMKTIEDPISFIDMDNNMVLFKDYKKGVGSDKYLSENLFHKQRIKKSATLLHEITKWLLNWFEETKKYRTNLKEKEKRNLYNLSFNKKLTPYLRYWLKEEKFVLAPVHGDLVPSNILINHGKISGVIDFESFKINGFPQMDMLDIISSIGYLLYNTDQEIINNTFFNLNKFSSEVRNLLLKFCEIFEMNLEDIVYLIIVYSEIIMSRCVKENEQRLLKFYTNLKSEIIEREEELIFKN